MRSIAPYLFCVLFVIGFTIAWDKFSARKEEQKNVYILTQKVFNDFKGSQELMAKIKKQQEIQKNTLDSIGAAISLLEKTKTQGVNLVKAKSEYQRLYTNYSRQNEAMLEEYTTQSWMQINKYISEYAHLKKYNFILGANGSGSLMYADSTLDITSDVVNYLNKSYEGK